MALVLKVVFKYLSPNITHLIVLLIVGHLGRSAILTAVSEAFRSQHQVDVGDLLLSVNSIQTTELSHEALQVILVEGATQYQVARFSHGNSSFDKNGFSAKGSILIFFPFFFSNATLLLI